MPKSLVNLYVHYVWATWDRLPILRPEWEDKLHACIAAKCKKLGCELDTIGGTEDHIHLLVRLHPSVSTAQAAKEIKGASSHFVSHVLARDEFFQWQGTYGAFGVSLSHLDAVRSYIRKQKEHHAVDDIRPFFEQCQDSETE